ncbi:GOLPH3/VPS74 family protein [Micromonospora arborensis]|uniref:GOLPH3/VPS74 family protein n=1 Tax=Micromonospora arborensis TaxID=2116518 RepID=UPI003716D621
MSTPPGAAEEPDPQHAHLGHITPRRPVRAVGSAAAQKSRIADEFFFMAHDDQTGKPRLFETALAFGLAAGLLAELYYERRITFESGQVRVISTFPPTDWLQHLVLDRIIAEPHHTDTRTWLAFLAVTSYEQVATRMWQVGLLRQEEVGRLWRQRTVYVPADMNTAAWSWARISQQVRYYRQLDHMDIALAGLTLNTHLDTALLDGAPLAARSHMRRLVEQSWPELQDLLADLDAALGRTVLSHRTA